MRILDMQAAYGRLRGDTLRLEPGLNVICAPNESGKSTWCSFLRTMLYGLPTRQSGPLADKNRYAPWTGEAMQGRMDLDAGGQLWTVLRGTRRVGAPMGDFSCTYTGTSQPVPDITGQNLGETLLGVPREVFQRSAFIGQSALAVTQDPELERRITSLLSTGQEDVSYSESYDRLKKQLNRRRHNKTGLIPALEQELAPDGRRPAPSGGVGRPAGGCPGAAASGTDPPGGAGAAPGTMGRPGKASRPAAMAGGPGGPGPPASQQLTALEQLRRRPAGPGCSGPDAGPAGSAGPLPGDTLTQARRTAQQRQIGGTRPTQDAWAGPPSVSQLRRLSCASRQRP